jgi:hypothetical protein
MNYDELVDELYAICRDYELQISRNDEKDIHCFQQLYALSWEVKKNGIDSSKESQVSEDESKVCLDRLVDNLSRLADECQIKSVKSKLMEIHSNLFRKIGD